MSVTPKSFTHMAALRLADKRVLLRLDLNVPIRDQRVSSGRRIDAALPSIRHALDSGAKLLIMSHFGRPRAGQFDPQHSLAPVAQYLENALGCAVPLCRDYLENPPEVARGEVVLLENVRFNHGELENAPKLARQYAELCEVFVMDAFGAAHRRQASTYGVARYAAEVAAGPLLCAELDALATGLGADKSVGVSARSEVLAVVGGAKVSSKLGVLEALCQRVTQLIPGGGIANTFLKAAGYDVGKSLYEPDLVANARAMLAASRSGSAQIPLPTDVVVAAELRADAEAQVKTLAQIQPRDMILDIGPRTARDYAQRIQSATTIVWNGPVGAFEFPAFAAGSEAVGNAIAAATRAGAYSIAGGGDTLSAIDQFGLSAQISYISTGGGAFLEWLKLDRNKGETLPAVAVLESGTQDKGISR